MINSLEALHGAAKAKETKTTFPTQVYSLETWPVSDSISKILRITVSKWSDDRLPIKQRTAMCVSKAKKEMEGSLITVTHNQVRKVSYFCTGG